MSMTVRNAAFAVPGQLGVQEGGYLVIGNLLGIPGDTAFAISLIARFRDLAIGIPFLKAATDRFEVTLIAKPYAQDLAAAFFPLVRVYSFVAPWTAFKRKYRLLKWPWRELFLLRRLRGEAFELGVSARWDPRDHVLLRGLGCGRRMGFARLGSQILLTDRLPRPAVPGAHPAAGRTPDRFSRRRQPKPDREDEPIQGPLFPRPLALTSAA